MIHFDFIVEDVDAENIFACIQTEITKCDMRKLRSDTTEAEAKWFDAHANYLYTLKKKMKNHRENDGGNYGS